MKVTNVYDINDYVSVNDDVASIHGYVVLTDEDGKTLFKKHNMIVKNGRDAIKTFVFNSMFDVKGINDTDNLKFNCVKFGNDNSITQSDKNELYSETILTIYKNGTIEPVSIGDGEIQINSDDSRSIKITSIFKLGGNSDTVISEAGLFLNNGNMFSRVAFAPLTIRANTQYTLNYYIYF